MERYWMGRALRHDLFMRLIYGVMELEEGAAVE
jgi:hypothetical protein